MANFLSSSHTTLIFLLSLSLFFTNIAESIVPPNATFKFINTGFYGEYLDLEYGATYRFFPDMFSGPFAICFYNTTPDAYTLAVRMGSTTHRRTPLRWVWEANRGRPVGENATFSLNTDGNLVLAQANGRVVFQSNTANKGVVGFRYIKNVRLLKNI